MTRPGRDRREHGGTQSTRGRDLLTGAPRYCCPGRVGASRFHGSILLMHLNRSRPLQRDDERSTDARSAKRRRTLLADSVYGQAVDLGAKSVQELEQYSDDRLWSSLAASDVLGLGLPETFGGFGALTDASIAAMALGRALAPVPYLGCADPSYATSRHVGGQASSRRQRYFRGARRIAVGIDPVTYGLASESISGGACLGLCWCRRGAGLEGDGSGAVGRGGARSRFRGPRSHAPVTSMCPGERVPIEDLEAKTKARQVGS